MRTKATVIDAMEPVLAHLRARDPVLGAFIATVKDRPSFERGRDPFGSLCMAIVYQQLAGKAAAAIHGRFLDLFPRRQPTPQRLAALHWRSLRAAGLSKQKRGYLKDLAAKCLDGTLRLRELSALRDEEVIAELTKVKGIGRWTAEMFLMFNLGRPDILPLDDLGIVNGMRALYGKPNATKAELEALADAWRPYRSTGCWYVWQFKDGR